MAVERQPDSELDELRDRWLRRLDESVERASFASEELNELARRYRAIAETAGSSGQRRAARTLAERFERAAHERLAASS